MSGRRCGVLYIVAAPLGNPEDITVRALKTLEAVDLVACEDTRKTGLLLSKLGLKKTLTACHAHTKIYKMDRIAGALADGACVALLSDCGSPGVSDPGAVLVRRCAQLGVKIVPLPGPSALTAALSVSGFPSRGLFFTGFLSSRKGRRRKQLQEAGVAAQVIASYESPYRVRKYLEDVQELFGDCEVVICREMTKQYEQIIRGRVSRLLEDGFTEKGEFTILVKCSEKDK